jgi:hypothetical protein
MVSAVPEGVWSQSPAAIRRTNDEPSPADGPGGTHDLEIAPARPRPGRIIVAVGRSPDQEILSARMNTDRTGNGAEALGEGLTWTG